MPTEPYLCPTTRDVLELFSDGRPLTHQMIAQRLDIDESTALDCLAELEAADQIVRARGGTDVPVWKPC